MYLENFKKILIERRGKVVYATLNRPEVRNSINGELDYDLMRLFWEVDIDPTVELLVLQGAGKSFSGGGDIEYMRYTRIPENFAVGAKQGKKILHGILSCEKPIIAKVHGDAIGLGATIALFCDIVIAEDTARFADPHVSVGLTAGDGGAVIWPALIGFARAKKYLLSGKRITGKEAAEIGLIAESVPTEELDAKVEEWVKTLTDNVASRSLKFTKSSINISLIRTLWENVDAGFAYEALSGQTDDHGEAIEAFSEKRKPKFVGK